MENCLPMLVAPSIEFGIPRMDCRIPSVAPRIPWNFPRAPRLETLPKRPYMSELLYVLGGKCCAFFSGMLCGRLPLFFPESVLLRFFFFSRRAFRKELAQPRLMLFTQSICTCFKGKRCPFFSRTVFLGFPRNCSVTGGVD